MMKKKDRYERADWDVIGDVHKIFSKHGKFISLVERLCWSRDMNWNMRIPGVYCFAEQTNKLFDPFVFLYVGRTQDLHKRFCEHKHRWLRDYVLAYPKNQIWWGYILEENIPSEFGSMSVLENQCWRYEKELGLIRGERLYLDVTRNNGEV